MSCKMVLWVCAKIACSIPGRQLFVWSRGGKAEAFIKNDTDHLYERTHKCVLCSLLPFWKVKARSEQIMTSSSHDLKPEPPLFSIRAEEQEEDCADSPGDTEMPVPG